MVDITLTEGILSCLVLVAAGVSYWRGFNEGIDSGIENTLGVLVKESLLSRFVNKDGDVEFCEFSAFKDACPKCGFHAGDNCEEHS